MLQNLKIFWIFGLATFVLTLKAQSPAQMVYDPAAYAQLITQYNTMKEQLDTANKTLQKADDIKKAGEEARDNIRQTRELVSRVYNGAWGMADSFTHLAATVTNTPNELSAQAWQTLQQMGCITDDIKKYGANDRLKALQNMTPREYNIKNPNGSYTYVYDESAPQIQFIDLVAYQKAIKKRANDKCQLANDRDMSGFGNDMLNAGQIKDRISAILQGTNDFNDDLMGAPMKDDNGGFVIEDGKLKRSEGSLARLLKVVDNKDGSDEANIQRQIFLLNQMMAKLLLMNEQMLLIAQAQMEMQQRVFLPAKTPAKEDKYISPRIGNDSLCSRPQFVEWCKKEERAVIGDTSSSTFKAFKEALRERDAQQRELEKN